MQFYIECADSENVFHIIFDPWFLLISATDNPRRYFLAVTPYRNGLMAQNLPNDILQLFVFCKSGACIYYFSADISQYIIKISEA